METDQEPVLQSSPGDQTGAQESPSPTDLVIERLRKLGVPAECLERREKGLVQYVKDGKWSLQDIISALLPGTEELLTGLPSTSGLEEGKGMPVWREFKQQCREGVRWVQWLMFDGEPEPVIEDIKCQTGGLRGVCGSVWGSNDIAYRCRTCEHDPTCAICVPCFRAGDHTNHDFSMIHTGGGCCDCGDITAWKATGFCSRHRGPGQVPPLPESFVRSVDPVLGLLLQEWAKRLQAAEKVAGRKSKKWDDQTAEEKVASKTSAAVVEMLLMLCNCSESMLTFTAGLVGSSKVGLLDTLLSTECLLPRKVVASLYELLFKLMGDSNFKYQFAKAFIGHYPRLLRDAIRGELDSAAGSRGGNWMKDNPNLYSFSVQIFTVPTLTPRLVIDLKLLDMLLETMKEVLLACAGDDGRLVVTKGPITNCLYSSVLEDVRFVMSHLEVQQYVARERPDLSKAWIYLLAYTQGMDPQRRVTSIHVEEENDGWGSAYYLELQMARIHPLFVVGMARTEHLNWMEGKLSHEMDISHGEDPEDEAVVGRHTKIGRISKESDAVWTACMNGGIIDMDLDSKGGDVGMVDGRRGTSNTGSGSVPAVGVGSYIVSTVPTAILWLVSECSKVLGTWLLLDWSRDLARSKRSSLEAGEGAVQRKGIHWRGRGGRGVTRESHGLNSNEPGNTTAQGDLNPGQGGTLREWLRRGRRTAGEVRAVIQAATGEPVGRRATASLLQNVEEGTEMDADVCLPEMHAESSELADSCGSEDNTSSGWWMGSETVDSGLGLGFGWNGDEWLAIDFDVSRQEISFHIPLHRFLALLLQKSMDLFTAAAEGDTDKKIWRSNELLIGSQAFLMHLLPTVYRVPSFASILMEHPLRLQVFCAQVRAGMWRRNGHSVLTLCDYYHSVRWCEESLDLDLFLLQCCGVIAPPEDFVERILARFGLSEYFSLFLLRPNEYETTLVQEMLALIIRLISDRGFSGFSMVEALRRELVRKLAIGDATHSQLIKSIPPRLSDSKHFQETLDAVATYCNPSGMQQGKYSLRKECWQELDIYHPRWSPRELQSAEDRYSRACQASAVIGQLPRWRKPFAPLESLCRMAVSRKVHDILRSVFFHAAFSERISESRAPEGVLITALHLLALGLDICSLVACKQEANGNISHGACGLSHESPVPSLMYDAKEPPPLLVQAFEKVYVGGADGTEMSDRQSLLSLMVMLMRRYKSGQVHGGAVESNQCSIGNLIKSLLGKFAELHRGCMYEIESIAPEILHRVSPVLNEKDSESMIKDQDMCFSEAERRKALARERQAVVMAKMKAAQEKFVASLQPSDEGHDLEKSRLHNKSVDRKKCKVVATESEEYVPESTLIVCALCRESGSKNPTSLLTFVQRSRLLAIVERGIPSWETGTGMGIDETVALKKGVVDDEGGSHDGDSAESQNSIELLTWIQMALNGDTGRDRPLEFETLLEFIRTEVPGNIDIEQRLASGGTTDVRMLESANSETGSDESIGEDNADSCKDSANSLLVDLSQFDKKTDMNKDENNKTRENAIAAVLFEYLKILSRNLKEQQQHADSDTTVVSPGPQSRRTSSLRASAPSSVEGLAHDSISFTDSVGVHISSCGHAVHQECLDRYLSSLLQRYYSRTLFEGLQIVDPEQGEFLCPVCRRLANSFLPVLQYGSNAGASIRRSSVRVNATSSNVSNSAATDGPSGSLKALQIQQALSLLHNAEELVWKLGYRKAVSKPLPKSSKAVFDLFFLLLCSIYSLEKVKSFQGRVCQSLLFWDVLRYSLLSAEIASRMRKPSTSFSEPENRLDALWKAANLSKGSILLPLLLAAKATQSQNRQTVLLRARGMQLLVGSICYGVSKDLLSEPFIKGNISQLLQCIDKGQEAADIQFWRRMADPVLAHDPFSSLLWLVFCLPLSFPSSTEPFISLVHLLYLVCVTQAIAYMGKSLASDPQLPPAVQVFVQSVATNLGDSSLFQPSDDYTSMILAESPWVAIRRFTLPYLRRCALLQMLLFNGSPDLHMEEESSWEKTTPYLTTTTRNVFDLMSSTNRQSMPDVMEESRELEELEQFFFLPPLQVVLEDGNSRDVALRWCQHISKETGFRKLLRVPRPATAAPFQLMRLPTLYQDLLQRYIKERCPVCSTVPDQPALCLLCGTLCCAFSHRPCCSVNRQSECYRHAMACGAGVGVFLMIRKTNILLQRCARQASWPSPYLDVFGEEDIEMSRGKPLYLSEERYAVLTAMVASHGLDHSSLVLCHTTRETVFWA